MFRLYDVGCCHCGTVHEELINVPGGGKPRREPIYRAILMVLVASVLVGAVTTLTGAA